MTSDKCADASRVYSVNRMTVSSATATGLGCAGLSNFLELVNVPSLHVKTFNAHVKTIYDKSKTYSAALLDKAVTRVKTLYNPADDGITDIHVSYDGTWHKRGHTSKTGMGCVIENKSGLVVDYEVLTTYCPTCATTGERLK